MAATRKAQVLAELPAGLPAEVERAVRSAGALPLAKLCRVKLTAPARAELEQRLVLAGLERTAKVVRVPLGAQLEALVSGGARVPLREALRRVKGGAKPELTAALQTLVARGGAHLVVRTAVETLVGGADRVLSEAGVAELVRAHAALGKVLKKVTAKGPRRSLLGEDALALVEPLGRAAATVAEATGTAAGIGPRGAEELVLGALPGLEHPVLGLVRVPSLVRALAGRATVADVHGALLGLAERGVVELRPDAGSEFLGADDAPLCPPGPRGTVFSHLRRLQP
ncbi:MAG: hypothetical protein HY908_31980 [Myxococcales bacterium]|nr:hypothetical protein [Myxococcales bacterium]